LPHRRRAMTVVSLKKLGGEIQGKTNKNPRHLFLILFFNTKQGGVWVSLSIFWEKK
jgi:hypothetical protein